MVRNCVQRGYACAFAKKDNLTEGATQSSLTFIKVVVSIWYATVNTEVTRAHFLKVII